MVTFRTRESIPQSSSFRAIISLRTRRWINHWDQELDYNNIQVDIPCSYIVLSRSDMSHSNIYVVLLKHLDNNVRQYKDIHWVIDRFVHQDNKSHDHICRSDFCFQFLRSRSHL